MDLLQWFREGKFSGVFIDSRKPLEGACSYVYAVTNLTATVLR